MCMEKSSHDSFAALDPFKLLPRRRALPVRKRVPTSQATKGSSANRRVRPLMLHIRRLLLEGGICLLSLCMLFTARPVTFIINSFVIVAIRESYLRAEQFGH